MIRKVLMNNLDLGKIEEDKNKWAAQNLETGGYVYGRLYSNGLAHVTHIIDGGPKAERTPISFSGDAQYANKVKKELQAEDPETRFLGEYHDHPWTGFPNLSGGDLNQLAEAKKARSWFVVFLSTKDNFKIFDLDDGKTNDVHAWGQCTSKDGVQHQTCEPAQAGTRVVEVPYQIVKTEVASKQKLLDRILKITRNDLLLEKTVLLIGLGSGGSTIAKYLGCTGIGRIILVDNEVLEVSNIIRHEGGIEDLGKPKVEICKRIIESHNPFTVVETYNLDATKGTEKLEGLVSEADLIIGSSGSPKVNNILNKFSVERRLPAIYGGVYERASGGFVLAVKPYETACFNCMFGLTSQSYSVDREAAERYGLSEDELHQQQGLWVDISFSALRLVDMALSLLQGKDLGYSLALYDGNLETQRLSIVRREDCVVCNEDRWLQKQELADTKKKRSLSRRLRRFFNGEPNKTSRKAE